MSSDIVIFAVFTVSDSVRPLFYTVRHKKGSNLFLSVILSKSTDFNVVFTVRFWNERYMWRCELHPPHLIDVATLPCESQKPKMHVNTTSAFNVNYKIAVTCIRLHW